MARKKKSKSDDPILASNRKAGHEFHIERRLECGIVLTGAEVKSAREGRVNLREAYARIAKGEVWLIGAHFSPYRHARIEDNDPIRRRKLLLNRREIDKLQRDVDQAGMTLVPIKLYLKGGRIKLEIGVAKGKKLHDKRDAKKAQEARREIDRARSERY